MHRFLILIFTLVISTVLSSHSVHAQVEITNSGGPLSPEQAAYDVTFYDLTLQIDPSEKRIDGALHLTAHAVLPLESIVLDLDTLLRIKSVYELQPRSARKAPYSHKSGKIRIKLHRQYELGEKLTVRVEYGGHPRVASRPPWDGVFTWSSTPDGKPWITTTCQGEGADLWWPCKDHPSDEPDSMALHIRVPADLVVASNGRLRSVDSHVDRTKTYNWFVSTPINNYGVAVNIGPYRVIERSYQSTSGDLVPVYFWVLPADYHKGLARLPDFLDHLRFHEELLGPYPFRADKYGIAQTPHLGMEHQTIIAYGANFDNRTYTRGIDWGFDALHHHELSHEWWGNLVTCADWKDMWIHEGFGTYMQALYVEQKLGVEAYHRYMATQQTYWNTEPVAPRESKTSNEIYSAPIYSKGATILHALRYLIGDAAMFKALRRMAYPDASLELVRDGSQTRLTDTDEFIAIAEKASGRKLVWFFDVYARESLLPVLETRQEDQALFLKWHTPKNLPFPMPIDVKTNGVVKRVEIPVEGTRLKIDANETPQIDPLNWVRHQRPHPAVLNMSAKDLLPYVGTYESDRRAKAIVKLRRDQLLLDTRFRPDVEIFPETARNFFFKVTDASNIVFEVEEDGPVTAFTLNFNNMFKWRFKKID